MRTRGCRVVRCLLAHYRVSTGCAGQKWALMDFWRKPGPRVANTYCQERPSPGRTRGESRVPVESAKNVAGAACWTWPVRPPNLMKIAGGAESPAQAEGLPRVVGRRHALSSPAVYFRGCPTGPVPSSLRAFTPLSRLRELDRAAAHGDHWPADRIPLQASFLTVSGSPSRPSLSD